LRQHKIQSAGDPPVPAGCVASFEWLIFRQRGVGGIADGEAAVPALPVPGLVAAEQQQRRPGGIEREKHPDLGPTRRPGPQFLQVMDPAALDPVHQRPAERGSFLPQRRDRLGDLDRGAQILFDQGGEPRGVLLGDLDAPRHTIPFWLRAGPSPCLRLSLIQGMT
jgi:hypothetical protein